MEFIQFMLVDVIIELVRNNYSLVIASVFAKQSIMKNYYIYIMANYTNSVLYTGVTSNLVRRVFEHKNKLVKGFSEKYNVNKLLYYEQCSDPLVAIEREKQIKAGSRKNKIALIEQMNPDFSDLYNNLI